MLLHDLRGDRVVGLRRIVDEQEPVHARPHLLRRELMDVGVIPAQRPGILVDEVVVEDPPLARLELAHHVVFGVRRDVPAVRVEAGDAHGVAEDVRGPGRELVDEGEVQLVLGSEPDQRTGVLAVVGEELRVDAAHGYRCGLRRDGAAQRVRERVVGRAGERSRVEEVGAGRRVERDTAARPAAAPASASTGGFGGVPARHGRESAEGHVAPGRGGRGQLDEVPSAQAPAKGRFACARAAIVFAAVRRFGHDRLLPPG